MRILWSLFIAFVLCPAALNAAKPNILFILADDLGVNDLACYGRKDHQTPHLDQLAREGTRFTSAYCAQPICSPSRAAILTGRAPARLHLTTYLPGRADAPSQRVLHPQMRQSLPLSERTLAEALRDHGYVTACIGKWHLGGKGSLPPDHGFDFYHPGTATTEPSDDEGGKGEYDLTRAAMAFVQTNRTQPFFLFLGHNSPHIPYAAKTNLVAKNRGAFEPVYAAVIETLDDSVGLLLDNLDALGLRTNTIVIFTSDNGGLHVPEGNHRKVTDNSPFRAGKGFLYEGGLRIPLLVRWPGHVPAGKVVDAPVMNTGWFATLFELAGLEPPSHELDAPSFASLLTGRRSQATARQFWHFPHYTNQGGRPGGAIRDGEWKFIEFYDTGERELYDLARDRTETRNVLARNRARADQMHQQLHDWIQSINAQTNTPNPDVDVALFQRLYQETDVSRHIPTKANAKTHAKVLEWRRKMNAALRVQRN